jgi:hypothetical protein
LAAKQRSPKFMITRAGYQPHERLSQAFFDPSARSLLLMRDAYRLAVEPTSCAV